jgi:CRISPR-associated protein Cmr6
MRPVSKEINQLISNKERIKHANFGLVFNKWLDLEDYLKRKDKENSQEIFISDYNKSKQKAAKILERRHEEQASYCQAMQKAGWYPFVYHAKLISPFVSGLGMTHPTETGLVLDHTSGIPYLPASSQKGVLRIAHIINTLFNENGEWRELEDLLDQGIVKKDENTSNILWEEDAASRTLFGFSEKKEALAGQLVVLDAYPLNPPELGVEILNPHFSEYYQGKRGPTEDQNPIPVKFLVVKPDAEFVFRLLLRTPFQKAPETNQESLITIINKNIRRAITEEGMGAKTALGFGRFEIKRKAEPQKIMELLNECKKREELERCPWLSFKKRRIDSIREWDWSRLTQLMSDSEAIQYQKVPEIAQAIKEAAEQIRAKNSKKWDQERDKSMDEWLRPSGIEWAIQKDADATSPLSPEEQALCEQIKGLKDWGNWKTANIEMETLPLMALQLLQDKFSSWGCKERNAKPYKQEAWKKLKQLLSNQGK